MRLRTRSGGSRRRSRGTASRWRRFRTAKAGASRHRYRRTIGFIAYIRLPDSGTDPTYHSELYVLDLKLKETVFIERNVDQRFRPLWSPDSKLLFARRYVGQEVGIVLVTVPRKPAPDDPTPTPSPRPTPTPLPRPNPSRRLNQNRRQSRRRHRRENCRRPSQSRRPNLRLRRARHRSRSSRRRFRLTSAAS